MSDLIKRKHKKQQRDSRKSDRGGLLHQNKMQDKEDSDDDGSGGGPGKRRQNGFKLEKLLEVIAKGRQKAQAFWRFLGQEGLDISDVKKTELAKQREKIEKSSDINLVNEKSEKSKEKALEIKEKKELSTSAIEPSENNQPAWEKAQAADSSNRTQMFGVDNNRNADIARRGVLGNRLAGSIVSGTTNPLGFAKQIELNAGSGHVQNQAGRDVLGERVQGAIHEQPRNHAGVAQFNHTGKNVKQFAFSKGVISNGNNSSQTTQKQSSSSFEDNLGKTRTMKSNS